MRRRFHFVIFCIGVLLCTSLGSFCVFAQNVDQKHVQRLSLARSFVDSLKTRLRDVDHHIRVRNPHRQENILPEGEFLLLEIVLDKRLRIDGLVPGIVRNKKILVSLQDISDVLQLSITVDPSQQTAQGWFIREDRGFSLNLVKGLVKTDVGEFNISAEAYVDGNDLFIPVYELGEWLDFDVAVDVSSQEIKIHSDDPLPIQAWYERRNNSYSRYTIPDVALPLGGEVYGATGVPVVDVSTRSLYKKNGGQKSGDLSHNATVRSVGDFAHGTLTTQSQLNNENNLTSVRATYKQEDVSGRLLGGLKAKKFEVGDVSTVNLPLGGSTAQELGVRITNTDALRTFSRPTTGISGIGIPGWDVELYRNNQFVAFQVVPEDGFYQFSDVDLFQSENNFRVVFHGPQGEVREENIFVPVDQNVLSRGDNGIYDISVSLDNRNTYNKRLFSSGDDEGALNVAALYERSIADGVNAHVGLRSNEDEGTRNTVGNIGVSTIVKQVLLNGEVAADDEGDMSAELALRRNFGDHEVGNTLDWLGPNFDVQGSGDGSEIGNIRNSFRVNGPIPFKIGNRPHYNISTVYSQDTEGDYTLNNTVGLNTGWKRFSFNEQVTHSEGSNSDEAQIRSFTNIVGTYGRNRLRLGANYKIKPDSELESVLASYRRDFVDDVDLELEVTKRPEQSLTEYSAKLDWQAGFARLSPSVRYNTEQDFFIGLNTRFGLLKDPAVGRVRFYDRNVTSSGLVSALVYLDANGDGVFNEGEEPLKDIVVKAPQNGGRVKTDENGVALFSRMVKLRLTDIFVDHETLRDPAWIVGFEGVSILPREGYIAQVEFPVHMSGEIDGVIYAKVTPLPDQVSASAPVPLRNTKITLYNEEGGVEQSVTTDVSGFYYFTQVPPGRYLLVIDEESAARKHIIRPEPQEIEIGYEGTVIYGNDIYVDTGKGDVPDAILSDLQDYKGRHEHVEFPDGAYDLVLNLGEYNSRLLMSVTWFKLKSRYNAIIGGGDLFVPPAQSYADVSTGKHTLRVGLKGRDMHGAYDKCRALIARDLTCKVEVYPSYMKQAKADVVEVGAE